MKKTGLFASSALLPLLVVPNFSVLTSAVEFKSIGPDAAASAGALSIHPKFRSHLKCPYADKWIAKGPKQAALELGLDEHGRKLQATMSAQGSCSYANTFSGGMTCMQFQGTAWTSEDMVTRCAQESGTWSAESCVDEVGGWCNKSIAQDKTESTAMVLSAMSDCSGSKMACEAFMSGTFVADGECLGSSSTNVFEGAGGPPAGVSSSSEGSWPGAAAAAASGGDDSAMKCIIAPGAIGAAHQAGFSKGYSSSCPGTPAQESPYMWPLSWSADTESQAMAYGSDDVVYKSRGRTFYMLDKNWKRSDTTYQEGLLRTIGQGPCEDIDEDFVEETGLRGCRKNQTDSTISTMIHREGLMYFISWKDDEDVKVGELDANKIEECTLINLAVIGNIRPDWFLDKRGDDTDVQYLGDQHVYYADGAIPKLVKQWRKKDFASQYFVMSMTGNPPNKLEKDENAPVEDDMHWPLILNIPGEGFGDDSLQVYRNHQLLDDSDEDLFKLIENYEAIDGTCGDVQMGGRDDNVVGPPVLDESESIPSNLEVDPMSWVSNQITFSPIWVAPVKEMPLSVGANAQDESASPSEKSVLQVSDRITVESCFDESTSSIDMSVHFHDVEPTSEGTLPWMALGYRPTELCAMTPPDGGSTPIVLVTHEDDAMPAAHRTELPPQAKAYSSDAFATMLASRTPLGDVEEYMDVSLEAPMFSNIGVDTMARASSSSLTAGAEDTVSLHFKQVVEGELDVMNLMYAIGMTSQLGSHVTRGCFQLEAITPCSGGISPVDTDTIDIDIGGLRGKDGQTPGLKSSANAMSSARAMVLALTTVVAAMIGL
mmetsp:Transcript_6854/g.12399  ORF Transcript_6854/g.12399 Transcript_6854/m.12399 type:complete len:826 (+) Transcript_6854:92-2569(+)